MNLDNETVIGHTIVAGNPVDGFCLYGNYRSSEDAATAASLDPHLSNDWWISPILSMDEATDAPAQGNVTVLEAFDLASKLHSGQVDKGGAPYIEHLVRVFLRVQASGGDHDQQVAALLHDSVEDGKTSIDGLLRIGLSAATVRLVQVLTRNEGESYMDYISRVKRFPKAVLIKQCDLEDNTDAFRLSRLNEEDASRLSKRYRKAMDLLGSES